MRPLFRIAIRLYPRDWRQRYGKELEALVEDARPGWRGLLNVVFAALVMAIRRPRRRGHLRSVETPMSTIASSIKLLSVSVARNAAGFAIYWVMGWAFVRLGSWLGGDGWLAPWTGSLLACMVGVAIAYKLRAFAMALFLVAMSLAIGSRFAIQPLFGPNAVNGAENHVVTLGIALTVVAIGAVGVRFTRWFSHG
jgi:hypothetical protein